MTEKDIQADLSTNETCPGCDGDVVLVAADDGTTSVQCPCSAATVLVAA